MKIKGCPSHETCNRSVYTCSGLVKRRPEDFVVIQGAHVGYLNDSAGSLRNRGLSGTYLPRLGIGIPRTVPCLKSPASGLVASKHHKRLGTVKGMASALCKQR